MRPRYLRIRLFATVLSPFSSYMRKMRMGRFRRQVRLTSEMTILDLGGHPEIWRSVLPSLDITILNLPGVVASDASSPHRIKYVEGDACNVNASTGSLFDLVFSNSVIEHVGGPPMRSRFAQEVRRLGKAYWIQTPSKWFPIEAHSGIPLWWFLPLGMRRWFLERWRDKLPAWTQMIEGTTVLERKELERLFPDAIILVERLFFVPKSYIAFKRGTL